MLDQNNTDHYNVKAIQINDSSFGPDSVLIEGKSTTPYVSFSVTNIHVAPAVTQLHNYANVFALNETFMTQINQRAERCGYLQFMEEALTFPPAGKFTAPNDSAPGCDAWDDIVSAAIYVNPCFNVYHLIVFCPFLWDEMGFPSLAQGPNNYFNMSDVQKAINAPPTNYAVCGDDTLFPDGDLPPTTHSPLLSSAQTTSSLAVDCWITFS